MSRKGLLKLVIAIACLTVIMGVYTVLAIVLTGPYKVEYKVVLLDGQTMTFVKGKVSMTGDTDCLTYDKENKVYVASNPNENAVGTVKKVEATVQKLYGKKAYYHIEIHRIGNGTYADPYNLNNADVLMERFAEEGAAGNCYALVNDIDLKDKEYKPLGDTNTKFTGTFSGNGHTVSNMRIVITNANIDNYVDEYNSGATHTARIGFFGYTLGATITDMNLVDYEIYVEKDLNVPYEKNVDGETQTVSLKYFTVGGLIGSSVSTKVTGAETGSKISGKITAKSWDNVSMYGGAIGNMMATDFENYDVNLTLVSNNSGDYMGGIAGFAAVRTGGLEDEVPVIKNCSVSVNAELDLTGVNSTRLAGIVANSTGLVCENVTVENFSAKRLAGTTVNNQRTNVDTISGAFDMVRAYESTIKNVQVKNVNIDLIEDAAACGFAHTIERNVTVINSSVSGDTKLAGYVACGFVYVNMGDIKYDANFTGEYAVKADVSGYQRAVGFVLENYGKIINEAENKQKVDVVVTFAGYAHFKSITTSNEAEYEAVAAARGISGFAHSMQTANAEIAGFSVKADLKYGVNMAGLVAYAGVNKIVPLNDDTFPVKYSVADAPATTSGGTDHYIVTDELSPIAAGSAVRNCDVEARFYTFQYTSSVGGAVVELAADTTIENVAVKITLKNEDANTNNAKSYAAFVGGVVARVSGNDAVISHCTVSDSIIEVGDSARIVKDLNYKWNVIGGIVGIVRNAVKGEKNYFIDDITIDSCKVTGLTIKDTADLTGYKVEDNDNFKVADGVAGFVGVLQSIAGSLSGEVTGLEIHLTTTLNTKCPADLKVASRLDSVSVSNIDASAESNQIPTNS